MPFMNSSTFIRHMKVWSENVNIFFFQAEDGIRDLTVTGVQTCVPRRRRHTKFDCDWISDVCSSDLLHWRRPPTGGGLHFWRPKKNFLAAASKSGGLKLEAASSWRRPPKNSWRRPPLAAAAIKMRTERRGVGEEWKIQWSPLP